MGCGGGRHSELLAAYGFDLDSVDVNPAMLEKTAVRLKAKNLEGNVQNGSILKLPFKDERFDIVVATGVLHQAKSIDEYKAAISELGRVTAPSGAVLLNIFTNDVWDDSYKTLDDTHNAVITKEGPGMTLLSKESFVQYMNDARFNLEVDYGVDIKQENTGARAVFRAVFRKEAKGAS